MTAAELISRRARNAGYGADLGESSLRLTGPQPIEVELHDLQLLAAGGKSAEESSLLDLHHALPGRARGDQRELLISAIVRDAAPAARSGRYGELYDSLDEAGVLDVADAHQRGVLASVMREHYWVRPLTGRESKAFVFPYHAAIPANFSQRGTYKMFRSNILLFLCWDGSDIDPAPIDRLCSLLSDREGLTLLDGVLLEAAERKAGEHAVTAIRAEDLLESDQAAKVRNFLSDGPLLPHAHVRFRQDFLATLEMPLPRHDLVEAAMLTLSLHLALYYYELAFLLGKGLDACMAASVAAGPSLDAAEFPGALRFRVATSDARPVRYDDPCAAAWRELDDRHLITLTPSIAVTNVLHAAWRSADAAAPARPDPRALARAMEADAELATVIDVAAGCMAAVYAEHSGTPSTLMPHAGAEQGIFALRQVVTEHLRRPPHTKTHASTLHYRSRAVVNQLVKRPFGGSLIRTRGPVIFFELDEAFLYLLVRFVLERAGEDEVPYREFLDGLREYGLAPQSDGEAIQLERVLERLGMLQRYSDAGEAVFVRHLL
jgi:hypothetical protein